MAEKLSDFNLPQPLVTKILNQALPDVRITSDARSALCKAASIFILYTTSHANRVAGLEKRANLVAQDVVEAAHYMDFDSFAPDLKLVYQRNKKSRDEQNEKRRQSRQRKKNSLLTDQPSAPSQDQSHEQQDEVHDDEDEEQDDDDEEEAGQTSRSFSGQDVPVVTIDDSND